MHCAFGGKVTAEFKGDIAIWEKEDTRASIHSKIRRYFTFYFHFFLLYFHFLNFSLFFILLGLHCCVGFL